jgi:hypothetical protein
MRSEINQTKEEINLSVSEQITQTRTYAANQAATARVNAGADTDQKLQSYVTTTTHTADLQVLSNQISSKVSTSTFNTLEGRVTTAESNITQNTNAISSTVTSVNALSGRMSTAESNITQNTNQISSTVTSVNALDGRMTTAETNITQNTNAISLRVIKGDRTVSGSVVNDTISEINASTKGIALTTAGRLTISAGNFKLDGSGNATMTNATLTGGTIKSSNYNTTDGTGMRIALSTGAISTGSGKFSLSSAGALTAAAITIKNFAASATLMSITSSASYLQSANYASNSAGTKINLADGSIDSKNFKVSSAGVLTATSATLTGGTIKTSNYTAATSSAKTVGAKINLAATGSTLLFDTANFKITGAGAVTATSATLNSCTISGGTFKVASTTQTGQNTSYIELKNTYTYGSSSEVWTLNAKPSGIYLKYTASGYYQQVDIGYSSISVTYNGSGTYIVPDAITTTTVYLDELRLNNVSGIALKAASWSSYGTTCMVGISEIPLRLCGSTVHTTADLNFTTAGKGLMFGGVWAYRMYNSEMALGADSKNMRFYAKNVYFNCPAYTNTGAAVTSDLREKHDVGLLDHRYLDMIKKMTPAKFRYNSIKNDTYHTGFIAQEVLGAMTQAGLKQDDVGAFVDMNGDDSKYALRYDEFSALLLLYIKDLEKQIQELKK